MFKRILRRSIREKKWDSAGYVRKDSRWAKKWREEILKPRKEKCWVFVQNCTRPASVFLFSFLISCLWITFRYFFGVQQGQRNVEQQGNLSPFLFYANNSNVLPALLANTAVNANQTIWGWLEWSLCGVTCQGSATEAVTFSFSLGEITSDIK